MGGGARGAIPLDDVVQWTGEIRLQETRAALAVLPIVSIDPRGGFLVADPREFQVRRYAADGTLLWHAGRNGGGPGEFTAPAAAVRLASGAVLVADRGGRLTTFDSAGARLLSTAETGLAHVEALIPLGGQVVLMSGVLRGDVDGPRLHLWDLAAGSMRTSFFRPLGAAANRTASVVAGWTRASVRGDTIAATFATSDTVYLFDRHGAALGKIPIPSAYFRRGTRAEPRRTVTNPGEQARWMSQFDFVEAPHWLPNGNLLVAYQSIDPQRANERIRHLVGMSPRGERSFESRSGPRLLAVDPRGQVLYFVHRDAEAPNRWAAARLRR
jgi:hypothetical protein